MGNKAKELAPIAVSRLTSPGLHFVGGVAGLALQVLPTGGRSWVLRATIGSRRRDMGLGGYPDVTLAGARAQCALTDQERERPHCGSEGGGKRPSRFPRQGRDI
jgi:Arm DNA-binding domain